MILPHLPYLRLGIAAGALALAAGGGWILNGWRLNAQVERAHTAVADVRAQQAKRIAEAERAGRAAVEADVNRQIELAERIARDAQAAVIQIERDRVAAVAAGRGLRDAARAATARACGDPSATPAAAAGGQAASAHADVLADVFGEMAATGGELAAEADRRRIAGLACEAVR